MNIVSLFTGIGGFDLAFEREGHRIILMCENNSAAAAVLRARFPSVSLVPDVRGLRTLPRATDLVCAGFPCQNLSSSGEKDGIRGDQSSLVDEVFRLLSSRRVPWVLIENVKFMLHLQKGRAMRHILTSLEKLGYRWAYRVMNSHGFGVPQRRARVFILASLECSPWDILFPDNSFQQSEQQPSIGMPVGFYWTEGTYATGLAANAVPPLKGGSTIGIPSPPAILFPDGKAGTPDIKDAERMQGFPASWTSPASQAAKPSERWKLVGNAVTVNVTRWLARQFKSPNYFQEQGRIPLTGRWPAAAWGAPKEGRFHAEIGPSPTNVEVVGLDKFLRFESKPLSKKATVGFIGRARAGNLNYPDGFIEALERYANHDRLCQTNVNS